MTTAGPSNLSSAGTVLIADDEAFIRLMIIDAFEEAGFRVLEASNAAEAIEILKDGSTDVDLLVSDIRMPGDLDGRGLSSWVREHRPATKVLLMSAYFEGQHVDATHGHHGFLRKPFMPPHLLAVAQGLLATRSA